MTQTTQGLRVSDPIPIGIVPAPVMADAANPELVAALAKMLRDAEQGRIIAMAVAMIVIDEDGDRASRTAFSAPSGQDLEWMTGAIETLKHRLLCQSMETARVPGDWPIDPGGVS